jgi:Caspase domain
MTDFAIVVGINDYPQQTGQRKLSGAAEDACDFADWVLAADGGGVAPQNLFFWTHPWPGPSAARVRAYPEAPDLMPSPALAAYLPHPTPWVGSRGPVVPDPSRAPDAREIVDTVLVKGTELAGQAMMGKGGSHRIYVFLAGHGVHTNEVSSLDGQTCFLAGDFHSISGNVAHGLVPCDSFRRSLLAGGFGEVFMFLDCCRVQDPVITMPAAVICAGPLGPAKSPWGVGNAAEAGKEALEVPGPPARGAFTAALVQGLRAHRDPGTNALPIASLEAFVTERIETRANGQSPAFEYNPRTKPGPVLRAAFHPAPAANPTLVLDLSSLPPGIRLRLLGGGLVPVAGFEDFVAGSAPVDVLNMPPGFYQVERLDGGAEIPPFRHPKPGPIRVG